MLLPDFRPKAGLRVDAVDPEQIQTIVGNVVTA
jgi:hypothetical protein